MEIEAKLRTEGGQPFLQFSPMRDRLADKGCVLAQEKSRSFLAAFGRQAAYPIRFIADTGKEKIGFALKIEREGQNQF